MIFVAGEKIKQYKQDFASQWKVQNFIFLVAMLEFLIKRKNYTPGEKAI